MTTLYAVKTETTSLNKVPYTATVLISEKAKDVLFNDEEIPTEVTRTLSYNTTSEHFETKWVEEVGDITGNFCIIIPADDELYAELAYLVNAHNGEFVIDPKYPFKRITESGDVVAPS